jgi:glycosidase
MSFQSQVLDSPVPDSLGQFELPRRKFFTASPSDWRDEVLYFLLPDRFSDGGELGRPMLDTSDLPSARSSTFRFDHWATSGGERWQGGTLAGVTGEIDYIADLGATAIWLGPIFKQRGHLDTFHGYAIQNFLDVDPRFGTRKDLVDLVAAAHRSELRVILDIVFNHSGSNWDYAGGEHTPPFKPFPGFYQKGDWIDGKGARTSALGNTDTGVWPKELQADALYTRAGKGNLGAGDIEDQHAEFRRTDFEDLRDFNFDGSDALSNLTRCYKYWLALTDCDGFRLDTLKHVPDEVGRSFCGSIKEFAANLGKADFFLVGEVAGSDDDAARYRRVLGRNLNATLDIGGIRRTLHSVAKGLTAPSAYLSFSELWDDDLGSHRDAGTRHVLILDDHDHVSGDKVRFSSDAFPLDHQVVAGVALQLFSLGIPCIYYGTEQGFAGPEKHLREQFLSDYNVGDPPPDKYLREAMFGPTNPLAQGLAGFTSGRTLDTSLPGFGPFGTSGHHCFNRGSAAYVRIAALTALRKQFPVLRVGRQYQRPISNFERPFGLPAAGELITWSRILDDEEALCVVNGNGAAARGGDVLVDRALNPPPLAQLTVIANTMQAAAGSSYTGPHPVGQRLPVKSRNGSAFVEIRELGPSEVLVLVNRASDAEEGDVP